MVWGMCGSLKLETLLAGQEPFTHLIHPCSIFLSHSAHTSRLLSPPQCGVECDVMVLYAVDQTSQSMW